MTKHERITAKILADKSVSKEIAKINYYSVDQFISDGFKYLSAVRQGRMMCLIHSVSQSGMSRTMSFYSCEKHSREKGRFSYRQYSCIFLSFGYRENKHRSGFSISGCGMNMIFATNYNIIRGFYRLGFITKSECEKLEQMTPTYFS